MRCGEVGKLRKKRAKRNGVQMKTYAERVLELEAQGCTTSDAQGVADIEAWQGKLKGIEARIIKRIHEGMKKAEIDSLNYRDDCRNRALNGGVLK